MQNWLDQSFVTLIYAFKHLANSSLYNIVGTPCRNGAPIHIVMKIVCSDLIQVAWSTQTSAVERLSLFFFFYGNGARAQLRVIKLNSCKVTFPKLGRRRLRVQTLLGNLSPTGRWMHGQGKKNQPLFAASLPLVLRARSINHESFTVSFS